MSRDLVPIGIRTFFKAGSPARIALVETTPFDPNAILLLDPAARIFVRELISDMTKAFGPGIMRIAQMRRNGQLRLCFH